MDVCEQVLFEVEENLRVLEQQGKSVSRAQRRGLQQRKKSMEAKLQKLQFEIRHRQDDFVDFQTLNIDHILLDESHFFKNLMFTTRHDRVAGLGNPTGSQRALNLLFAIRTMQQQKGRDFQASFFSGTTISNSLTELYLIFKYLIPKMLEKQDIRCFDAWAAVFAKKTRDYEFNVTNQIVQKERFRYFKNIPELAGMFALITDFRTAADIGIDRPGVTYELIDIPQSREQAEFAKRLIAFARSGNATFLGRKALTEKEKNAKMLIATDYANKMAMDMRLINQRYGDHPHNKASVCAAEVVKTYREYEAVKGTQLIFTDTSTYHPMKWNVCEEIKRKLVEDHGIPAGEIRFIQEFHTRDEIDRIQDEYNAGKVRILMGSTKTLGTGKNVQRRVIRIHNLDAP